DPLYNLATGMQILAEKWRVTLCVGDKQPSLVEHWYTATWAYNGLSTTNNPNNPNFSTTRGICRPGSCPSGSAPYQERVWGWMEFPPTSQHWRVVRPAYPRLSDLGTASRPPAQPDPTCALPASCAATRPLNVSECLGDGGVTDGGSAIDAGVADAGSAVDAGVADGGGVSTDGGARPPDGGGDAGPVTPPSVVVVPAVPEALPVARGCGCSGGGEAMTLVAGVTLLARWRRRRR
ncbi:MAG: hypothetical protein INH37_03790, partial [Myxococcaceae bacterium]|nr:hypothetical protein [Myxococcaceae bacterium]